MCELSTLKAEEHGIDSDGHRGLFWTLVILAHFDLPVQAPKAISKREDARQKLEALAVLAHDARLISDEDLMEAVEWERFEIPSYFFWLAGESMKGLKGRS